MCSYFALFLLAVLGAANALPPRLAFSPIFQGRIVGGSVVPIEEFPYQVSLGTYEGEGICGGSIISEKHVLTAGHCVKYLYNGFVRAGSNTRESGGSLHAISNVLRHGNYTEREDGVVNDIAILTVKPNFVFDTKQEAVKVFGEKEDVLAGQMSTISGYGVWDEYGAGNESLMAVSVPMVSRELCNSVYEGLGLMPILEDRVCAGDFDGGKDSCQGDSGGPLVVNGQQVGIVSYGVGCGRPNIPGIYTRVAYFYDWIVENTRL